MHSRATRAKHRTVKKSPKTRLDSLLVARGLIATKSAAASSVLAGRVFSGETRLEKPGTQVRADLELSVQQLPRYVSRGGTKLEGALEKLSVTVADLVWLDVGASTGGFTDCLLQHGAAKVYAVDVGKGQLAEKLRQDTRVINREGVNARHLTSDDFAEPITGVVIDASFIGLGKLLPALSTLMPDEAVLLAMIKPQFEAGRELARRFRGVISDPVVRDAIIEGVKKEIVAAGFSISDACDSSLSGPKGNLEHFVYALRAKT